MRTSMCNGRATENRQKPEQSVAAPKEHRRPGNAKCSSSNDLRRCGVCGMDRARTRGPTGRAYAAQAGTPRPVQDGTRAHWREDTARVRDPACQNVRRPARTAWPARLTACHIGSTAKTTGLPNRQASRHARDRTRTPLRAQLRVCVRTLRGRGPTRDPPRARRCACRLRLLRIATASDCGLFYKV